MLIKPDKKILEKYHTQDSPEPVLKPRQDWNEAFVEMHNNGDDKLLIDSVFEDENWD